MKIMDFIKGFFPSKTEDIPPRDTTEIYTFNVAGVSYHDSDLEKIIRGLKSEGMLEKYQGLTNSEIKENGTNLCVYEGQYIKGAKLEPYVHKGKDAIRVILPDYKGHWFEVGSVPKGNLERVIALLDSPDKIKNIEFEIVGGSVKAIDFDDDDKPFIDEYDLAFGVAIYVTYETE